MKSGMCFELKWELKWSEGNWSWRVAYSETYLQLLSFQTIKLTLEIALSMAWYNRQIRELQLNSSIWQTVSSTRSLNIPHFLHIRLSWQILQSTSKLFDRCARFQGSLEVEQSWSKESIIFPSKKWTSPVMKFLSPVIFESHQWFFRQKLKITGNKNG